MPRYTDYASFYAVVNQDGTTTVGEIQYHWEGSHFIKILHPRIIDAETTTFRIEVVGRSANEGDISIFSPLPNGKRPLMPMYIAWLRMAIEQGLTTLEQAESVFADFVALGASAWALSPSLPNRIDESAELAFFGEEFTSMSIPALDVLKRPNGFVDSAAIDSPFHSWFIPNGVSTAQAIGAAWDMHPLPELANAARALEEDARGIERASASLPFSITTSAYQNWIQKLYLAFFLRPADPAGYNYYAEKLLASEGDVAALTAGFGASPEYVDTYAGLRTSERIDAIYRNLFNRPAEEDGLRYWGSRVEDGTFTIGDIALSILVGAQNADASVIAGRLALAKLFTASLDTALEVLAYTGLNAAETARNLLATASAEAFSPAAATRAIHETLKYLGTRGNVTQGAMGDHIELRESTRDVLIYSSADGGRTDIITGFSQEDHIDLSALTLDTAVQRRIVDPHATNVPDLFAIASAIVDRRQDQTHIYLDVDHDGDFSPDFDLMIVLVGHTLMPSSLTM